MNVLVACEFSGTVRDAFRDLGHFAVSCDILPTETPGPHYCGDVRDILTWGWDLMIAHPPCTYLTNAGVRWLHHDAKGSTDTALRWQQMREAAEFFQLLWNAPIPRVCVENPVMHGYARKIIKDPYTQIVQPWQYGHGETKATCLWLKGLPPLGPTDIVSGREHRLDNLWPSPDRWKERSRTYPGIAAAMAAQWGGVVEKEAAA